jgi:hypothetical protein
VTSVAAAAGLATLLQFAGRPYRHYALLTAPCLVLSAVILAARMAVPWLAARHKGELAWFGLLGLAALPLAYTGGDPNQLHVWRIVLPPEFAPNHLWHRQPDVAADLAELEANVKMGEGMYVLPPRRNSPHFLLGTRSPADSGYGFAPLALEHMDWRRFDAVLEITGELDETDRWFWIETPRHAVRRSLSNSGFRPEVQLKTMRLYRPCR